VAGVAYVCFITDVFSRMIVGWRVAGHMRTPMVLDAIEMARWNRGLRHPGLRCHSDAGSQFTSIRCGERLAEIGATPSIGSVGDSYDNALAETVNGYYNAELIRGPARSGPWKTVEEVELATLGWVHWHNTQRLHGYLNDLPPVEFEQLHAAQAAFQDPGRGDLPVRSVAAKAVDRLSSVSSRPHRHRASWIGSLSPPRALPQSQPPASHRPHDQSGLAQTTSTNRTTPTTATTLPATTTWSWSKSKRQSLHQTQDGSVVAQRQLGVWAEDKGHAVRQPEVVLNGQTRMLAHLDAHCVPAREVAKAACVIAHPQTVTNYQACGPVLSDPRLEVGNYRQSPPAIRVTAEPKPNEQSAELDVNEAHSRPPGQILRGASPKRKEIRVGVSDKGRLVRETTLEALADPVVEKVGCRPDTKPNPSRA
jgi:hypothetical protein